MALLDTSKFVRNLPLSFLVSLQLVLLNGTRKVELRRSFVASDADAGVVGVGADVGDDDPS